MANYQNLRSKIKGKLPRPQDLEYGQLAVNFNDEEPFLSFVTDANEIAKVPTEKSITPLIESQVEEIVGEVVVEVVGTNFYTKTQSDERYVQKGETPTDVYTKAETDEKIASGDTNVKNWVGEQGYLTEHQSLADYYNKTEVDEKIASGDTAVKTWVGQQGYLTEHQSLDSYYNKTEVDEKIASGDSAVKTWVGQQGYLTEHQSLDNYYTKAQSDDKYAVKGDVPTDVYTKSETDEKILSGDTDVKTWVGEQGYLTEHQSLADYYTKTQVDTALNSKAEKVHTHVLADITDYVAPDLTPYETSQHAEATYQPKGDYALLSQIPDVSSYFNGAVYDSEAKRINFKHGDSVLAYIDATDFIKDGMVSNVEISGGNLVITFNSDAGKQPISIPLTDIFNPNNYYTKTEANTVVESGCTEVKNWVQSQNYLTEHQSLANYYTKSEVDTELDSKQDTLTAGSGITIENNVISATGGGGGDIDEGMLEATANSLYTIRKDLDADKENLAGNYYNKTTADGKYQTKKDTDKNYFDKNYINERLDVIARGLVDLSENSGGGGGSITVDPALDINSENPVANSAITTSLNSKSNTGHTHTLSEITDYVAPDLTPYETTSHASATFELKAWRGTQAQYDALETKDADRLYIITE